MTTPDEGARDTRVKGADARVGRFRYWFDADRWEWSDDAARLHGYRPGDVVPTTTLLASHQHPDDDESFAELVQRMRATEAPFSSRHRIVDADGRTRRVIVMGRTFRQNDVVAGTEGFYVDVGDVLDESIRGGVADHVQHFREHRAVIEQAKGMLMVVYGLTEDRAFDILRWLSQTRNVPVHDISRAMVDAASDGESVTESSRRAFDLLVIGAAD